MHSIPKSSRALFGCGYFSFLHTNDVHCNYEKLIKEGKKKLNYCRIKAESGQFICPDFFYYRGKEAGICTSA